MDTQLAAVVNAYTVGTFAYVDPANRPPIAHILDAATNAVRGVGVRA